MEYKTGLSTKDKVLIYLKENNGFVSGEDISVKMSLSRAAVNACVKNLRTEGYEIESSTRKGYRLLHSPDVLSAGEIAFYLNDTELTDRICFLEETTSTNDVLLSPSMENKPTGTVAVSDCQSGGRGRMGRPFYSPKGRSVYLSYLIRPLANDTALRASSRPQPPAVPSSYDSAGISISPIDRNLQTLLYSPAAWTALTSCTAVATANAIETVSGIRPRIKWVNDLYIGEKKLTGILTQMDIEPESAHVRRIVAGIGVNANGKNEEFPPELQEIAGTVESACGKPINRAHLAAEMIKELDRMVSGWPACQSDYLNTYRKDCFIIGKDVTVITPGSQGRAAKTLEITDSFALRVRYENGDTEDLNGGEISLRF